MNIRPSSLHDPMSHCYHPKKKKKKTQNIGNKLKKSFGNKLWGPNLLWPPHLFKRGFAVKSVKSMEINEKKNRCINTNNIIIFLNTLRLLKNFIILVIFK